MGVWDVKRPYSGPARRGVCPSCGLLWLLHPWDDKLEDFVCRTLIPERVHQ